MNTKILTEHVIYVQQLLESSSTLGNWKPTIFWARLFSFRLSLLFQIYQLVVN